MHRHFQITIALFLFTSVLGPLWAQETLEQRVLKLEQRVQALEKAAGTEPSVCGWRSKGQIKNSLVAKRILPLFEADPSQWNAILYRHEKPCADFTEYLQNWYAAVPEKHKAFVKKILDLFDVNP